MCTCVWMWRLEVEIKCLPLSIYTFYFETGPLLDLGLTNSGGLAGPGAPELWYLPPQCWDCRPACRDRAQLPTLARQALCQTKLSVQHPKAPYLVQRKMGREPLISITSKPSNIPSISRRNNLPLIHLDHLLVLSNLKTAIKAILFREHSTLTAA